MEGYSREDLLKLHAESPLFDLHCDTLMSFPHPEEIVFGRQKGQTDLPRFIAGGYRGVVMAMYVHPKEEPEAEQDLKRMLEIFFRFLDLAEEKVGLVLNYNDFVENFRSGKLSVLLGIEGLHPFGTNLKKIEEYHRRGVRVFTLTWNNRNKFADSCQDSWECGTDYGLTQLGREAVKLINELGGIIDLAHASKRTFMETLELSSTPPIVSHTGLAFMRDCYRNIDDEQLEALGKKHGVATVFFIPEYLNPSGDSDISLEKVVQGYNHIKELAGIDCAAIGTDFDGTNNLPCGIAGPQDIWKLSAALLNSGFSEADLKKILGQNFLRILKEACP